jgi:hypothetical protein
MAKAVPARLCAKRPPSRRYSHARARALDAPGRETSGPRPPRPYAPPGAAPARRRGAAPTRAPSRSRARAPSRGGARRRPCPPHQGPPAPEPRTGAAAPPSRRAAAPAQGRRQAAPPAPVLRRGPHRPCLAAMATAPGRAARRRVGAGGRARLAEAGAAGHARRSWPGRPPASKGWGPCQPQEAVSAWPPRLAGPPALAKGRLARVLGPAPALDARPCRWPPGSEPPEAAPAWGCATRGRALAAGWFGWPVRVSNPSRHPSWLC